MTMSTKLPSVLQRPSVRDGSLSVYRVLAQAIELINQGTFEVLDEDVDVIVGNLMILKDNVE